MQDVRQGQRDRGLVDQHHGVGKRHAQQQQLTPVPPSAHDPDYPGELSELIGAVALLSLSRTWSASG
jgi:hypothetical protein